VHPSAVACSNEALNPNPRTPFQKSRRAELSLIV
jgi:hypothetical protein